MSIKSTIEWTTTTWNPMTGCSKISDGCKNCYAERMAKRLQAMGNPNYINGFTVSFHEHMLKMPFRIKKPQLIFVNSMSDLFHENVPESFILEVFNTMKSSYWHTFQILTKRSQRLIQMNEKIEWPDNVWMGVTVESQEYSFRINDLLQTNAKVKFLSLEPLLSAFPALSLVGVDWIIVGGESGPGARPVSQSWVTDIRDQCLSENIPFFFKQWGGTFKKRAGRILDGRTWDQIPSRFVSQQI